MVRNDVNMNETTSITFVGGICCCCWLGASLIAIHGRPSSGRNQGDDGLGSKMRSYCSGSCCCCFVVVGGGGRYTVVRRIGSYPAGDSYDVGSNERLFRHFLPIKRPFCRIHGREKDAETVCAQLPLTKTGFATSSCRTTNALLWSVTPRKIY